MGNAVACGAPRLRDAEGSALPHETIVYLPRYTFSPLGRQNVFLGTQTYVWVHIFLGYIKCGFGVHGKTFGVVLHEI